MIDIEAIKARSVAAMADVERPIEEGVAVLYESAEDVPVLLAECRRQRQLLAGWLRQAESGRWRDRAELSLDAHPIADDTRVALEQRAVKLEDL